MSSKKKKYLVTLIIIIIFLFIMSLFIILFLKSSRLKVNENDVILEADSNTIIIKSFLTASDEFGKIISDNSGGYYGYLEFSVRNVANGKRNFQLYLTKSDININEISGDYVKIYLTDYNNNPFNNNISSFNSFNYLSDRPESKYLYSDELDIREQKKYKLRVWISDNYVINDINDAFTFVISARAV